MNKKSYIMQFVESSLELPEENRMEAVSLIMEMLPFGMLGCYCEEDFPLYFVSSRLYQMMGYNLRDEFEADVQGKAVNTIYYDDIERVVQELGGNFYVGMEFTATYRMPRKDGSLFWVMDKCKVVETKERRLVMLSFRVDITEIMEKQRNLQQSRDNREQLNMIYALSRDYFALWRVDLEKDMIFFRRNENWQTGNMFDKGPRIPKSYSKSLEIYAENDVHPEDREVLLSEASIDRIRERLQTEDAYSVRLRRKEIGRDEYEYVEWRIVRLVEDAESHMVLIGVKNVDGDVLKEAKQQSLLKEALAQAVHANKAKTTFLSNMSHDIRTPMNAIIGFTSIAESQIDNKERVQDCLKKIMSSSNHLLNIINDILDMSRIESGKITLQEKNCNLLERIRTLVTMIRPQMKAKRLEFFVDTMDIQDKNLIFDPIKLDQVLINILGNAVKFTPQGGMVSFKIRQSDAGKSGFAHYEFIIKDTGVGMSEEFLKHIFDPFEREETSTVSGIEGTGLGMAITKNTVDIMGGTIEIESQPARGSTFKVSFDFKFQDASKSEDKVSKLEDLCALTEEDSFHICNSTLKGKQKEEIRKLFCGKRVLVVEDNELNREIITEILENIGFTVETASDGSLAVEKIRDSRENYFDLVLMDIQMPVMDGYEATRTIRYLPRQDVMRLPIIAMTANAFEEDRERAMENGMNAHISKPLNIETLLSTLGRVLSGRE